MNEKLNIIINHLKNLTLVEAAELVKEIETIFGVDTSISPYNIAGPLKTSVKLENELEEEKTEFNVKLNEFPLDKKIAILKIVRNVTGLGLKESKAIVDNVPKIIKEKVNKEEGESIKNQLESVGGKVILI